MLNVITLYTIDKILNEDSEIKLSPLARMLYINCLIHHFKDKKPTVLSAVAFNIFINDIKDYDRFERLFQELHKAGLIVISQKEISFNNCWGKHIDRSKLDRVSPDEFVAGFVFQKASAFKEEMAKKDGSLLETARMKHKISEKQYFEMLDMFCMEQDSLEKTYSGFSDCAKHLLNWIPKNTSKSHPEVIVSNNKMLGKKKEKQESEYACKCDRCGSEGTSTHARVYFEKINDVWKYFCSTCWGLQSNGK